MVKKKCVGQRVPLLVVTKGNSEKSIFKGDLVHYSPVNGNLTLHLSDKAGGGWIPKDELTEKITDFEYVEDTKREVVVMETGREAIVAKA